MRSESKRADVVVVGSGPGGATVARQLACGGRKVVLLERGRNHAHVGTHVAAMTYCDRLGFRATQEGLALVRAITAGGSTIMYCGAAMSPPGWLKSKYGIDLDRYCAETTAELGLEPLPDEVLGEASKRIMEAGADLGVDFQRLPKFIDPQRCKRRCGGTCMLGCRHDAKWTARRYIADMQAAGGEFVARANVQEVVIKDGVATGVLATTPRGMLTVEAKVVVLAAGGLGTPCILQRSQIHAAGQSMFVDPLVFVTGVSRHSGNCQGPPMGVASLDLLEEGILLSDLIDPWLMWLLMTLRGNPSKVLQFFSYRRQMGLMVKIGDERAGWISFDDQISKPLTHRDRLRLNRGAAIARQILIKAGCAADSIMVGPVRGAHPGATAAIGDVVDTDLQTEVKNLYVADASVLPEALDRPVVLTLICLSKRLAAHLQSHVLATHASAAA